MPSGAGRVKSAIRLRVCAGFRAEPMDNACMTGRDGMRVRSGPWSAEQITDFLRETAIPLRLASSGAYPIVQSLWFVHQDDALWCATQSDSVLVRRLRASDRCGFEVSADTPPYRGVRGTGHGTVLPGAAAEILPRLIDRYLGPESTPLATWLLSRLDREVAVRVDGLVVTTWDYSARM